MSVGCLEPQFFATFLDRFNMALQRNGVRPEWIPTHSTQSFREDWPKLRSYLEDGFKTQPRDYWASLFHGESSIGQILTTQAIYMYGSRIGLLHGPCAFARGSGAT